MLCWIIILYYENRTYADYLAVYSPLGPDKALNTNYFDYLPGSRIQLENQFREARDQKIVKTFYDYELRLTYETGKESTYWDANVIPTFDEKGHVSGIVILCIDVTRQFRAIEMARSAKTALKVMLDLKKETQKELEDRFALNINNIILPLIARLKGSGLKHEQREIVTLIESTLFHLTSDFARKLNAPVFGLTPREISIAALIKAGKTTKEIADMLVISTSSIESHRANIRKKLGLTNQKINLRVFLSSF